MKRCINIDWLEVLCLESPDTPRDEAYFVSRGYYVKAREYGTRHMAEVFTIYDQFAEPMLEVRRAPRNAGTRACFYREGHCTLRLVNRYCYFENAVEILYNFMATHGYAFQRITRLDIALDFVRFDSGDYPEKVIKRIVNHKYAKIYQSTRATIGEDKWADSYENYIRWGNPKSMVVTTLYEKTKELRDKGMKKPWIVQAWLDAGLIDNPLYISKDGEEVKVFRVEFRIQSSAKGWLIIDKDNGETLQVEHTLEAYWTRDGLLTAFASLCEHYFDFRILDESRRKYDCPKKELFKFGMDEVYKLSQNVVRREYDDADSAELRALCRLAAKCLPSDAELYRELITRAEARCSKKFNIPKIGAADSSVEIF